eukprot:CAMPEP_0204562466 /NCGR_PEP_ID=MMETSP0661-20131031/33766_1 /ASSEMBLY_ACC=CAM_ASM_000606 /TAXON_ID=109239 /ORGANISM="Alexandrium margalefi, Strain AMGDE01CS-322" /LENGTH=319 /DNA_ID=CAMNT_0051569951 /DNA_START=48 /DNA_END=1007 /DNA_ORIENTATION=-
MTFGAATAAFDASRYGTLHDAQYDSLGRRLATASEDKVVRIWNAERQEVLSELRGHRAPVKTVCWAHGRFSSTLASAASDGHVVIWREARPGDWQIAYQQHVTGSVSEIAFCPPEYGLVLAVGGLDDLGVLTVLSRREILASPVQQAGEQWLVKAFPAHDGGVVGLSWAPSNSAATLATGPAVNRAATHAARRLVTAGADGGVSVWHADAKMDGWNRQHSLADERHPGAVRDVAWRPNVGIPSSIIASCTEDGLVATWAQDMEGQAWRLQSCWRVEGDARRLAWSRAGMLLAVSVGDDGCSLFKEGPGAQWELASSADQ